MRRVAEVSPTKTKEGGGNAKKSSSPSHFDGTGQIIVRPLAITPDELASSASSKLGETISASDFEADEDEGSLLPIIVGVVMLNSFYMHPYVSCAKKQIKLGDDYVPPFGYKLSERAGFEKVLQVILNISILLYTKTFV
jgi:hypothetical protein